MAERDKPIGEEVFSYPTEEAVRELCGQIKATLQVEEKTPARAAPTVCRHTWERSFYVWMDWCRECGTYANQITDDFDELIRIARYR